MTDPKLSPNAPDTPETMAAVLAPPFPGSHVRRRPGATRWARWITWPKVRADLPEASGASAPAELAALVRQAVTDALATNGARPPVRPTLTPEWRVHVTAQSGGTYTRDAVDEADARKQAALFKHGRAVVQYRLVAPWTAAAQPPPEPGGSAGDEPGRDSAA